MNSTVLRVLRQTRFQTLAAPRQFSACSPALRQSTRQFSSTMQPMTADDRPNILSDIKRDHAQFFSLHRRFQEEPNLSDHDKQVVIWQVSPTGCTGYLSSSGRTCMCSFCFVRDACIRIVATGTQQLAMHAAPLAAEFTPEHLGLLPNVH